ncbi:MAG: histidine--tRNA ligase [Rhodopseudomonas palustris]|nr:MAG: histidine--tRNA ligase [Rhodopseudomonas palustris]
MSDKMQKPKKPAKLRARLPRGLADRGPAEIAATRQMVETIREVYERYGFEPVETPAFEYTDALGKFLPDQDRPNEGVFSLQDDDEQWISLRYDLTAPLARYVAENFDNLPKPYRSYRHGWVFRNEKPGPGRFRQFMQFDADTVGSASPAADAEMCMMAADAMEALGIPRGSYVVKVNNRKVLDGTMDAADVPTSARLTALRAIDKLDKFPIEEIKKLLGEGRKDESGDFTKGAGLTDDQIEYLVRQIATPTGSVAREQDGSINIDLPPVQLKLNAPPLQATTPQSALLDQGKAELAEIQSLVLASGYGPDRIRIDPSVVRGLEYYTGPVYEVELLIETKDDKGRPVRFGSVGGGGRYDGLVSRFRGEPVPATGFSIGVSRLQAALTLIGKINTAPALGPVVVTVFDRDRIADYQKMVARLRAEDIHAELYLGNPKSMGNQLKYADKRNAPCVIIQGSDEKNDPEGPQVIVKDLRLGAELAALDKDRDDYLQRQADAQRKVPELDLVDEVRRIMARHDLDWK